MGMLTESLVSDIVSPRLLSAYTCSAQRLSLNQDQALGQKNRKRLICFSDPKSNSQSLKPFVLMNYVNLIRSN